MAAGDHRRHGIGRSDGAHRDPLRHAAWRDTMTVLAALPPLTTPNGVDILGVLPEVILASGFVILLMLDLVTTPAQRGWLAGFGVLAVAAAFGATVWGWFDTATPHTVYFGSFAYDRFRLFINAIILISTALVLMISPQYLNRRGLHYGEYYSLILAAATGMMILAGASSLMVIFLAIDLYILSGFSRAEPRSHEAAMKYLLLGGFASGFLLFGMALIYGETGHTQLAQIAAALQNAGNSVDPLLMAGVALLFVGLAFQISAAPFHTWPPHLHRAGPTPLTVFMSVSPKVAAFAT